MPFDQDRIFYFDNNFRRIVQWVLAFSYNNTIIKNGENVLHNKSIHFQQTVALPFITLTHENKIEIIFFYENIMVLCICVFRPNSPMQRP